MSYGLAKFQDEITEEEDYWRRYYQKKHTLEAINEAQKQLVIEIVNMELERIARMK